MSGKNSTESAPMNDQRQQIQDDDYAFPYHYVPQFREGYTHTYSWSWGLYYVSAMEFVVSVPRTPSLRRRRRCAEGGYAVAATVSGSTMLLAGRQLCGSSCARSRFFNEGRRSKTSLR